MVKGSREMRRQCREYAAQLIYAEVDNATDQMVALMEEYGDEVVSEYMEHLADTIVRRSS